MPLIKFYSYTERHCQSGSSAGGLELTMEAQTMFSADNFLTLLVWKSKSLQTTFGSVLGQMCKFQHVMGAASSQKRTIFQAMPSASSTSCVFANLRPEICASALVPNQMLFVKTCYFKLIRSKNYLDWTWFAPPLWVMKAKIVQTNKTRRKVICPSFVHAGLALQVEKVK